MTKKITYFYICFLCAIPWDPECPANFTVMAGRAEAAAPFPAAPQPFPGQWDSKWHHQQWPKSERRSKEQQIQETQQRELVSILGVYTVLFSIMKQFCADFSFRISFPGCQWQVSIRFNYNKAIFKINSGTWFQSPEAHFSMDFFQGKGAGDVNIPRKAPLTCQYVPSVWLRPSETPESAHTHHPQNRAGNGKSDRPLTIVALLGAAIILPS